MIPYILLFLSCPFSLATRPCTRDERVAYCPGYPELNPQQPNCEITDDGTANVTACRSYVCRPSDQIRYCGHYDRTCTINCTDESCQYVVGSCKGPALPLPTVDGVVVCQDEDMMTGCENRWLTDTPWAAVCGEDVDDPLFKYFSGDDCIPDWCTPQSSLDICEVYTTECNRHQFQCQQERFHSNKPIRLCTKLEWGLSGAHYRGECGVICDDEDLLTGCGLYTNDEAGWHRVVFPFEQCDPLEFGSSCDLCRRNGSVIEVLCSESLQWKSVSERRNIPCSPEVALEHCGAESSDCTQISCDAMGQNCMTVECGLEDCSPEEQQSLCGAFAPECRKRNGRLHSCGVVTPGEPYQPSRYGRNCRSLDGNDFCRYSWTVGTYVPAGETLQFQDGAFRRCTLDEAMRLCGPMWKDDPARTPCEVATCDAPMSNCTIVKGTCGCPSYSRDGLVPCGKTKVCEPASQYCGEGAVGCDLHCSDGRCAASVCKCQEGRHPWPRTAMNCIGVWTKGEDGCGLVTLQGELHPGLDYTFCEPCLEPNSASRHLLQVGYHIRDCEVADAAATTPVPLLLSCPNYKCELECFGDRNCTKRYDRLGCLNKYVDAPCPAYMSEYFCGVQSSCNTTCSWADDLQLSMTCRVWPALDPNDSYAQVKAFLTGVCKCDNATSPGFGEDVRPCGHEYYIQTLTELADVYHWCGAYGTTVKLRIYPNGTRTVDSCVCSQTYRPVLSVEPLWSPFTNSKWGTRVTYCGGVWEERTVCSELETQCGPFTRGILSAVNYTGEAPVNAICQCAEGTTTSISGIHCGAFVRPCRPDEVGTSGVCAGGSRSCSVRCDAYSPERCQVIPETCSVTAPQNRSCTRAESVAACGQLSVSCTFDLSRGEPMSDTCRCDTMQSLYDETERYGVRCPSRHYTFLECTEAQTSLWCGDIGRVACRIQVLWLDLSMVTLVDELPHPDVPPPLIDVQLETHFWRQAVFKDHGSIYVGDSVAGGFRVSDGYSGTVPYEYPQCLCNSNPWSGLRSQSVWRSSFDFRRWVGVTPDGSYRFTRCDSVLPQLHKSQGWCPTNGNGLVCNGLGYCPTLTQDCADGACPGEPHVTQVERRERQRWWDSLKWDPQDYNRPTAANEPTVFTPPSIPGAVPSAITVKVGGANPLEPPTPFPLKSLPFLANSRYYIRTSGRWPPFSLFRALPGWGQVSDDSLFIWSGNQPFPDIAKNDLRLDGSYWTSPDDPTPGQSVLPQTSRPSYIPQESWDRVLAGASIPCLGENQASTARCLPPHVTDDPSSVFSIYSDPRDWGSFVRMQVLGRVLVYDGARLRFTSGGNLRGSRWVPYTMDYTRTSPASDVMGGNPVILAWYNLDYQCYLTIQESPLGVVCGPGRPKESWFALFTVPFFGLPTSNFALVSGNGPERLCYKAASQDYQISQSCQMPWDIFQVIPANDYSNDFLLLDTASSGVSGHSYEWTEARNTLKAGPNPTSCSTQLPKWEFFINRVSQVDLEWVRSARWTTTSAPVTTTASKSSPTFLSQVLKAGTRSIQSVGILSSFVRQTYAKLPGSNYFSQVSERYKFSNLGGRLRSCAKERYDQCPQFLTDPAYLFGVITDLPAQNNAMAHADYQNCIETTTAGLFPNSDYFSSDKDAFYCGELQTCETFVDCDIANAWRFVPLQFSSLYYSSGVHGDIDFSTLLPTISYLPDTFAVTTTNSRSIYVRWADQHPLRTPTCENTCGSILRGFDCRERNCLPTDPCDDLFRGTECEGKTTGCKMSLNMSVLLSHRGPCNNRGTVNWFTGTCDCDFQSEQASGRCIPGAQAHVCPDGRNCHAGLCDPRTLSCICGGGPLVPESNCTQTAVNFYCSSNYTKYPSCNGRGICNRDGTCSSCLSSQNEYWSGDLCETPNLRLGCVHGNIATSGNSVTCVCDPTWSGVSCNISLCPYHNGNPCNNASGACHIDPNTGRATCTDNSLGRPRCSNNPYLAGCACQLSEGDICGACNFASGPHTNICKLYRNASGEEALKCDCPTTRTGPQCETPTCGSCGETGTCERGLGDIPICRCSSTGWPYVYGGDHCEVDVTQACGQVYFDNQQVLVCDSQILGSRGDCIRDNNGVYGCRCKETAFVDSKCHNSRCDRVCPPRSSCTQTSSGTYSCVCENPDVLGLDFATFTCTKNNCKFGATPDSTGSICVCPVKASSYLLGCPNPNLDPSVYRNSTDDCLYDKATGERCGATYLFGKEQTHGYFPWSDTQRKMCVNGTCVCLEGYQLSHTGVCVPLCSVNHTEKVVSFNSVAFCICLDDYNATAGCHKRLCDGRGVYHSINGTCSCNQSLVYSGPLCEQSSCVNGGISQDETTCVCEAGFTGRFCDSKDCGPNSDRRNPSDCSCLFPFQGVICSESLCLHGDPYIGGCNCTGTPFDTDPYCTGNVCSGSNSIVASNGSCVCKAFWSGDNCESFDCGPFGNFNSVTGQCTCAQTYSLDTDGRCTLSTCNGTWVVVGGQTVCSCPLGYKLTATEGCEPLCLNGGTPLQNDTCGCAVGWSGASCGTATSTAIPLLPSSPATSAPSTPSNFRRQSLVVQLGGASLDIDELILEVSEVLNVSTRRVSVYHLQAQASWTDVFLYVNSTANVTSRWASRDSSLACSMSQLQHLKGAQCSSGGSNSGLIVEVVTPIGGVLLLGAASYYHFWRK